MSGEIQEVLNKTIQAIENGKKEIFDIAENTRNECDLVDKQLIDIKERVAIVLEESRRLEIDEKRSRYKLAMVSKNFKEFDESDIKEAYEDANDIRIKLMLKRQEELELIRSRNNLELRIKMLKKTLEKAERLVTQVSVALGYLSTDFNKMVEDMNQKQFLGVKIIKAQEDERQRVAREIHDGPAQSMANLILKAEFCEKLIDRDTERVKQELKDLKKVVRNSLNDVRKIIYDLRPMSLDDLGLVPTVQRYGEDFTDETGIEVEVKVLEQKREIDSLTKLAVFRIIQESLNNVRKYSKAHFVEVIIEINLKFINILIKDDGIGFDTNKKLKDTADISGGFGIMGMKERAELLNGSFEIKSKKNEGTRVIAKIPLYSESERG